MGRVMTLPATDAASPARTRRHVSMVLEGLTHGHDCRCQARGLPDGNPRYVQLNDRLFTEWMISCISAAGTGKVQDGILGSDRAYGSVMDFRLLPTAWRVTCAGVNL